MTTWTDCSMMIEYGNGRPAKWKRMLLTDNNGLPGSPDVK